MNLQSNRKPILGQRSTLIKHMTSASYKLEPAIWSRGTGQLITWFDMCHLIITWCHLSKKYKEKQGCMSLPTSYLKEGRHLARLHRHRRRRRHRAYAPTSNTASHDNHERINSWVSFSFLYGYGAPLGGPKRAAGPKKSTNVESESYSDYFNPMADISDDTLPKKLKADNMIGTLSWSECFPW